MTKVDFLIDGFNLYHSVRTAQNFLKKPTKWLNIRSLCESYLHLISGIIQDKVGLGNIYYFSALADHLEHKNPDVTNRHKALLACLYDTGINIELNRFKPKKIKCPECHNVFTKYEEKETDVSISVKVLEIAMGNSSGAVVLMTGDTDVAPAVKTAIRLFPSFKIVFAFPYQRKNKELSQLANGSFSINSNQYVKHQFSNPYVLKSGKIIPKPSTW